MITVDKLESIIVSQTEKSVFREFLAFANARKLTEKEMKEMLELMACAPSPLVQLPTKRDIGGVSYLVSCR